MKKLFFSLFIILIILLTLFPRITEVACRNFLFGFDQGRDYLAIKNIVVNHKFTLIGSEIGAGDAGFTGIFQGPGYYYFLTIPFILFHGDPYGGVVLMFAFGLATIIMSFLLGKKIFGSTGGLIISLLVAICPAIITQSRFIWNSHPSSLFVLLTFYFTYKLFDRNSRDFFLAAFFSGFIYNFEIAISIPLCISLILYNVLILKVKEVKKYLLILFGFLLAFSPMLFFELRHHFIGTKGLVYYLFIQKKTPVAGMLMEKNLYNHLQVFIFNFFDSFPHIFLPSLVFFIIFIFAVILFLFQEEKTDIKKFILYLLMLPLVSFAVFGFLRNNVYPFYLIELNFAYIIIFSYITYSSYLKKNTIGIIIFTVLIGIFLLKAIPDAITTFRRDYQDYGGDAKIAGKKDALDFIYKDSNGKPFGLLVFTPPIYTYAYDYVIWWYGQKKYHYIPYQEKKGTVYLLIEVDHNKPWSYKGWLETVIKQGKIIKTKELPSGFIVQERKI